MYTQYKIYFSASVYSSVCVHTVYLCTRSRVYLTTVDLCVHTAVCIPRHRHLAEGWGQRLAAGLLYLCLILIVYYKNPQKFCKRRGSTNKFDLYINKLGCNYYKTCFCFKKKVYRILIRIIQQSSSIQQIQIAWCTFKNYIISRWWVVVHISYLWGYNVLTSFIILVGL